MKIVEWKYRNQIVLRLEQIDGRNPKKFRTNIKKLGPTKIRTTPNVVLDDEGKEIFGVE